MTADGAVMEIRAELVVGADGRHSTIRQKVNLQVEDKGAPVDVLWFRLPKPSHGTERPFGIIDEGKLLVMIDRGDYWQCAFNVVKGDFERIRAAGIDASRQQVARLAPFAAEQVDAIGEWDQVSLLSVSVDSLRTSTGPESCASAMPRTPCRRWAGRYPVDGCDVLARVDADPWAAVAFGHGAGFEREQVAFDREGVLDTDRRADDAVRRPARFPEQLRGLWPSFGFLTMAEDGCSAMTINAKAQTPADGTSAQRTAGPPSERLAARISARQATPPSLLDDFTRLDLAMYRAIAETPTPTLDEPLRRLSNTANHSKLWLMVAGIMQRSEAPLAVARP